MELSTPIETEILTSDELGEITGRARKDQQIVWLRSYGWKYSMNAAGSPIVGRWYARMKLAGVELADSFTSQSVMPDFSKAR
jgi:hypothetical protein